MFEKKYDNKDVLDVLAIKNKYLKFKYLGKLEEVKAESAPIYNMINIDFSTFKSLKEKSS